MARRDICQWPSALEGRTDSGRAVDNLCLGEQAMQASVLITQRFSNSGQADGNRRSVNVSLCSVATWHT